MIDGYLSDDEGINSDDVEQGKSENKAAENYNLKFEKKLQQIQNQEDKSYFYEYNGNYTQTYANNSKIIEICQKSSLIIIDDGEVPLSLKKDQKQKELKK